MNVKKVISVAAAILTLLCVFCGCKKKPGTEETPSQYNYTPASESTTQEEETTESVRDFQKAFIKDLSWQKNFTVKYVYNNAAQGLENAQILEKRASTAFSVEYLDTGLIMYYKANGDDIDSYVIDPSESGPLHSVITEKKISSISSLFMKLSNVDATLPAQSNVLYMYDEIIAGRNCHKYIQRAYSDAKLTESVYVWIDAQYGFAMKCEDYDANETLKTSWEVKEFSAGGITADDVYIDLSQYQFAEEVG
ncbi:MAG: hypothetical protein IJK89_03220 [Clostridia bacterium]|nr:hypothetical protein [Clostridia bacterium]